MFYVETYKIAAMDYVTDVISSSQRKIETHLT